MKPVNVKIWRPQPLVGQNLSNSLSVDGCLGTHVHVVPDGQPSSHPEAGNVYLAAEVNLIAESLFEKRSNVVNRVVPFVFGTSEPQNHQALKLN